MHTTSCSRQECVGLSQPVPHWRAPVTFIFNRLHKVSERCADELPDGSSVTRFFGRETGCCRQLTARIGLLS